MSRSTSSSRRLQRRSFRWSSILTLSLLVLTVSPPFALPAAEPAQADAQTADDGSEHAAEDLQVGEPVRLVQRLRDLVDGDTALDEERRRRVRARRHARVREASGVGDESGV